MTKKPEQPSAEDERRARLGQALRANLRRRKDQARGRDAEEASAPAAEPPDQN